TTNTLIRDCAASPGGRSAMRVTLTKLLEPGSSVWLSPSVSKITELIGLLPLAPPGCLPYRTPAASVSRSNWAEWSCACSVLTLAATELRRAAVALPKGTSSACVAAPGPGNAHTPKLSRAPREPTVPVDGRARAPGCRAPAVAASI